MTRVTSQVIHVGIRDSFVRLGGSLLLVTLVTFGTCVVSCQHVFAMVHDQADLLESGRKVSEINLFAVYRRQMTVLAAFAWNTRSVEQLCALGAPRLDLWHYIAHNVK
jgi:hypothetical protein